jgi:uncharacterized damage-inducible protein DinB
MLKRSKGRLLLVLLVITGLAGTINPDSLTQIERKYALKEMKESKAELLKSVRGLSEKQLNYKPTADQWSVKECIYHIAMTEESLWKMFETTMKAPANPDKKSEIKVTDEQLVKMLKDRSYKVKTNEQSEPKNTPFKTADEAMGFFKEKRSTHIKYMKFTTEDLRNHVAQTPLGWLDCYQLYLFIAAHSNRHTQQINEVINSTGFPAK